MTTLVEMLLKTIKTRCAAALAMIFAATVAHALPPVQHPVQGIVSSIDLDKEAVVIAPESKGAPTEFFIQEKRTRLRRDGKTAALRDLVVGLFVKLYYRQEAGKNVATEVSWESEKPPLPPKTLYTEITIMECSTIPRNIF